MRELPYRNTTAGWGLRQARRDLDLRTIRIYAIGYLQAFIAEYLNHAPGKGPFLGNATSAWLDDDPGAVIARSGCQAFTCSNG